MTTLREAAQQALEALEQIAVLAEYGTTGPGKCHSRALNAQQATALRLSVSDLSRAQINALRAALAEPENWELRRLSEELERCKQVCAATSEAWREEAALAEPVQEPPEFPPHDDKVHAGAVYWYVGTDGKYYSSNEVKLFMRAKNKSLHYEPPKWVLDNFDLIPLYTAPPQCKPLTEEEILSLFRTAGSPVEFARAIEAKHGIL